MTAAVSRTPEPYQVPEGGLGSFLTATVGDWSDEALNADNYYDIVKPTADQLAEFGREEDDRIAHVATGETIIPMAVFEEDPALKEALFTRMRDMGIDPERYIVGNELNSINPVTGQPEFFLKKIFKGIKKAVKGVVKVFKKLAPVILSVGLNFMFPGLGTIAAGALGSGIGTLVQGGSLKDAFKSALIGGAVGGLASGIGSVAQGGEFMAGVKGGLPTGMGGGVNPTIPAPDVSKIVEGTGVDVVDGAIVPKVTPKVADPTALTASEAVQQSAASSKGGFFSPEGGAGTLSQSANTAADLAAQEAAKLKAQGIATGTSNTNLTAGLTPAGAPSYATPGASAKTIAERSLQKASTAVDAAGTAAEGIESLKPYTGTAAEAASTLAKAGQISQRGFFGSMKDFFTSFGTDIDALKQAFLPDQLTPEAITDYFKSKGFTLTDNQLDAVVDAVNPGFARKYGPLLAGATFAADAAGLMDVPEMEALDDGGFGKNQRFIANPLAYRTYAQAGSGYNPPPVGVADGGGMDTSDFPRRNGRISGPGTETSDDIPAMLSDGEFVMTAKAVRGAGNGSREAGMRKMYNMMSQFERAV